MESSEKREFCAVLAGLAQLKPGGKLTPEAYEMWWAAMRGWTLENFRSAAAHLAKSVEFMPSPFHFEQLLKSSRCTTAEAWTKAVGACGSSWSPQGFRGGTCGDPMIDKAVAAIGGYAAIAQCEKDKLHFLERHFTEAYEAMQDANDVRVALPQLGNSSFGLAALNKQREQRKLESPETV